MSMDAQIAGPLSLAPPTPVAVDWPSYLVIGDIEISNVARTLSYLQAGLGGGDFRVFRDPADIYAPIFARNADVAYVSPAFDPAPWYDSSSPESGEFFGLILDRPGALDSVSTREYASVGGRIGGAAFGQETNAPRVFEFTGTLCASTVAGREWGFRWLANVLSSACDPCSLADLGIYSHMPQSDPDEGYWIFHRVAETSGIREVGAYSRPTILDVAFTVVAGNPLLYRSQDQLLLPEVLNPSGQPGGACIDFCEWIDGTPGPLHTAFLDPPVMGTLAPVVTINAPGGVNGVEVNVYSYEPDDTSDPDDSMLVTGLAAGSSFIIDAGREEIWYTSPDGFTSDGSPLIQLPAGRTFPWRSFQVNWCDAAVWISARTDHPSAYGAEATVGISTVLRSK